MEQIEATPSAEEILERLKSVDIEKLKIKLVTEELKGKHAWIFVVAMPIAALLLVLFTLIGLFLFDSLIVSFVVAAILVFTAGKIVDNFERKFRLNARNVVIERIAEYEGEFGLIPHFKHFLPKKYTLLRQQVRKKRFMYIDQYISAIFLLQERLDEEKFKRIWHIKYPETVPEELLDPEAQPLTSS